MPPVVCVCVCVCVDGVYCLYVVSCTGPIHVSCWLLLLWSVETSDSEQRRADCITDQL